MTALSVNFRGALLMVAAMAFYTINDAFMKSLSGEVPFFQAIFVRGIFSSVLLFVLAGAMGHLRIRMNGWDGALVALRTFGEVAATYFFVNALFNMPLANISAIMQALPLTVALAGALFLREAVGWRRLSAILVGFVGVMLIIRPGPDGFNLFALYGLLAVVSVTIRDIATRKVSSGVPSLSVAIIAAVAVTAFGAIGTFQEEMTTISTEAFVKLALAAVFLLGGYITSIMVMRGGDIGFIAPFRYTSLIAALILGFVIFGDWPDPLTLLGAAIVVATGIFTLYRERRANRQHTRALRVR